MKTKMYQEPPAVNNIYITGGTLWPYQAVAAQGARSDGEGHPQHPRFPHGRLHTLPDGIGSPGHAQEHITFLGGKVWGGAGLELEPNRGFGEYDRGLGRNINECICKSESKGLARMGTHISHAKTRAESQEGKEGRGGKAG